MGRPPLPVGTFGRIGFLTEPSGAVQARARFRDYDGRTRLVSKTAGTRAAAERALRTELATRLTPGDRGSVTAGTRMADLADAWLEAPHGWSTGTMRTYRSVVGKQIKPALGRLCIREVTPGAISRALAAMAASSGPAAAKTARACLSGMLSLAVGDGAIAANPVRDARPRIGSTKRAPRALTGAEQVRLVELFHGSDRATALDLTDLVDWMLATGCRIGEALAARFGRNTEGRPLLDLQAETWEINGTVVRVPGEGLTIQSRPKTAAGWRVIALPGFAVELADRRRSMSIGRTERVLFPAPVAGTVRDPVNVSGHLRELLDGFDCDRCKGAGVLPSAPARGVAAGRPVRCTEGPWSWVTSHTLRKTVATRLDEAGLSPRQVADQLGHANPSMTLDVYFGRQVVSADAARVLAR